MTCSAELLRFEVQHHFKKARPVQQSSQRVLLSLSVPKPSMATFMRDITQSSIESNDSLERRVFIKAPKEMPVAPGSVLHVVRPLYSIP